MNTLSDVLLWPIPSIDFFFRAEDCIRDRNVTGVQTCALPICRLPPDVGGREPGDGRLHRHRLECGSRRDGHCVRSVPAAGRAALSAGWHDERWGAADAGDRKSTRLNSSHVSISYAVFCLKKKK